MGSPKTHSPGSRPVCPKQNTTRAVDKEISCGNVLADRRFNYIFIEELLAATPSEESNHLKAQTAIGYDALALYSESYGDSHRASRRQSVQVNTTDKNAQHSIQRSVLSVESPSDAKYTDSDNK
eukprot:gb/GEZJ01003397.1/.p2 GENE.gb/GEZJ01003397.1/~~gb/GEZJ01003397.1/.p2  ORF type:complete len:124 (-),score=14.46 gb/GEZJ01003397.1/:35-406(-)